MLSSVSAQTISKGKALDLNSIDTPNRKAFLVRQDSKEEHSAVLGKGAFGVVLQANYQSTPVAVKLIKRADGEDKVVLPNERNILECAHENVIRIIKIVQEPHHFIIIMERLNGNNLHYILNHTEEIPLFHQMRIIHQVSSGLEYLHQNSIIHLDIKPANILVCPGATTTPSHNPLVKLCDFGNSQQLKRVNKSQTLKKLSGTVSFMAPEMLKKNSVSTKSDVYALAITIWQLLHRKLPYSFLNNEDQVIYNVVKNNLRPCDDFAAGQVERLEPEHSHWWNFHKKDTKVHPCKEHTELPTTEGLTWKKNDEEELDPEDCLTIDWNKIFSVDQRLITPSKDIELKYQELYTKCWHRKPAHRPEISEVLVQLNDLLSQFI